MLPVNFVSGVDLKDDEQGILAAYLYLAHSWSVGRLVDLLVRLLPKRSLRD